MELFALLVPLAPLFAAFLTALPRSYAGEDRYKIGWICLVLAFFASVAVFWRLAVTDEPLRVVIFSGPWHVLPSVELSIDRLAATMMVVISGIGTLLYRYSMQYLQQDPGHARYQTLLAGSIASLLFMVSSADLLTLFLFWQLLSWLLCLLSHNYSHVPTAQSSFRTFIMLRAGDVAFLAGIVLAYKLYGTVQLAELFANAAADPKTMPLFGLTVSGPTAVTLLIFIGAMSKSAQFPLHMWLPDSLYAPTPIHGLLHAGIINAGGFLLNRLAPLYVLSPTTLHIVFVIGLLTTIVGTSMMLVQNDIKKTLGYSTIGQMGYMMMECGLGAFSLAVFHLIAHGLFKATIFLNCGDVIHQTRKEPKSPPNAAADTKLSPQNWAIGSAISLILPLLIMIGAHYALGISLESQGLVIFLLFAWVTASQAMLTLFRVKEASSMSAQIGMLVALTIIATAYLFAAEEFTHFLYPDADLVTAYFEAAAIPQWLFISLAALFVLFIGWGWTSLFQQRNVPGHRQSSALQTKLYLLFANRLYLDGVAIRLFNLLGKVGRLIDSTPFALIGFVVVAVFCTWQALPEGVEITGKNVLPLCLLGLLLPLFPLHLAYQNALTRVPGTIAAVLSVVLPAVGGFLLVRMLPSISELLPAVAVLAIFGAIWAALKALTQESVPQKLSFGGIALYSILWWNVAANGNVTSYATLFFLAALLVNGGLWFAWGRIRSRYGDLSINRIGGLFKPMPKFALCLALLIMAATGLPPFGLFFGYLGMLFGSPEIPSLGFWVMIAVWFAGSWYLFQLMRHVLFGPHREDLRYEDLKPAEIAVLACIVICLVALSVMPQDWFTTVDPTELARITGGTK